MALLAIWASFLRRHIKTGHDKNNLSLFTCAFKVFTSVKCKNKEKKMYQMSLESDVTKGFLVNLRLLCFQWRY